MKKEIFSERKVQGRAIICRAFLEYLWDDNFSSYQNIDFIFWLTAEVSPDGALSLV